MAYGIKNSRNENIGVITLDLDLKDISKNLTNIIESDNSSEFIVCDMDGHVIASTNDKLVDTKTVTEYPIWNNIRATSKGTANFTYGNEKYIASYVTSELTGWKFISKVPENILEKSRNSLIGEFLLIIVVAVIGIVAIGTRFSNSLSKNILKIKGAVLEAASGNFNNAISINSRDELQDLANSFNDMAAKLDVTVTDLTDKNMKFDAILNSIMYSFIAVDQKLRIILINSIAVKFFGIKQDNVIGKRFIEVIRSHQLNEILQKTIDSNTSQIKELTLGSPESGTFSVHSSPIMAADGEGTNAGGIITIQDITAMKKLEQIRTEFVSNVTHELKTPLTSIRGFVETLRNGAVYDTSVAPRFLEIIDIEAERLTMLINDILQLSEIENAGSDTNIEEQDLSDIISEVLSILAPEA
jgi:PAS domain S-box-containing protein